MQGEMRLHWERWYLTICLVTFFSLPNQDLRSQKKTQISRVTGIKKICPLLVLRLALHRAALFIHPPYPYRNICWENTMQHR